MEKTPYRSVPTYAYASVSESMVCYLTLTGALLACKNHVSALYLHWKDSNGGRGVFQLARRNLLSMGVPSGYFLCIPDERE